MDMNKIREAKKPKRLTWELIDDLAMQVADEIEDSLLPPYQRHDYTDRMYIELGARQAMRFLYMENYLSPSEWQGWTKAMLDHWEHHPPEKDEEGDPEEVIVAKAALRERWEDMGYDAFGGSEKAMPMNYAWQNGFIEGFLTASEQKQTNQ